MRVSPPLPQRVGERGRSATPFFHRIVREGFNQAVRQQTARHDRRGTRTPPATWPGACGSARPVTWPPGGGAAGSCRGGLGKWKWALPRPAGGTLVRLFATERPPLGGDRIELGLLGTRGVVR